MAAKYEFCKGGNVIASFPSMGEGITWAEQHGYVWLKYSSVQSSVVGEYIEYFADLSDLPEGITAENAVDNANVVLDYYGLGYEPCIVPRE